MSAPKSILRMGRLAIAATLAIAAAGSTQAAGFGHAVGGGGFHAGGFQAGGFHAGGFHGGSYGGSFRGWSGAPGWHGGSWNGGRTWYGGGWRGGFYGGGWRGGYYGPWRGGWAGWRCCGWGYYPWVGLGWSVAVLPFGYQTLWWGGTPYYYSNNFYYVWDSNAGQYEAVQPPSTGTSPPSSSPTSPSAPPAGNTGGRWTDLFAYPKGGQSTEQQARDREECRKWAIEQSGFDPAQPAHEAASAWAAKRDSYLRAEGACLQARNYSVK